MMNIDDDELPALIPVDPVWIPQGDKIINNHIYNLNNLNNNLQDDVPPGHILNVMMDYQSLRQVLINSGMPNVGIDWVRSSICWIVKTTTETTLQELPVTEEMFQLVMENIYNVVTQMPEGHECEAALATMTASLMNYVEWLGHSTLDEVRNTVGDLEEHLNVVIEA